MRAGFSGRNPSRTTATQSVGAPLVTYAGEPDPKTGMVVHFSELDAIVKDRVIARLDHRNLNEDVEEFKTTPSTVEMIAKYVWERLHGAVPGAALHRVRIWEDQESFADYRGEER